MLERGSPNSIPIMECGKVSAVWGVGCGGSVIGSVVWGLGCGVEWGVRCDGEWGAVGSGVRW